MSDAAYACVVACYDLAHAVRGWWDRHPWATPAALVFVAMLAGGCYSDDWCRGRYSLALTRSDSIEIARTYECSALLGKVAKP